MERKGWLVSVPGDQDVMLETLPDSTLPDVMRLGAARHEARAEGKARGDCGTDNRPAAKMSSDPMFGLIDAHRKADAAHKASLEEVNRLEAIHDPAADWIGEKPCHAANDAFAWPSLAQLLPRCPVSSRRQHICRISRVERLGCLRIKTLSLSN
jgi:hypothetical protein